jgi:hypothetical protein
VLCKTLLKRVYFQAQSSEVFRIDCAQTGAAHAGLLFDTPQTVLHGKQSLFQLVHPLF